MSSIAAVRRSRRLVPPCVRKGLSYALLTFIALVFLAPIAWMLKTALTAAGSLFLLPVQIIPSPIDFSSFASILRDYPFATFYSNSLQVAVLATVGQLFACSFTAFALTQLRFRAATGSC